MQTTLLGLAIAFILALIAALVGPYFVDWNQFRPQFEAEASRIVGAPVRVGGKLDALLLPTPTLRLRSVAIGGDSDPARVRAGKLDVEFSLGALMRGEWRATELSLDDFALDLGLDRQGRFEWPATAGRFNLGSLAIDRMNVAGRIALHDASSGKTLRIDDLKFSGDVRALASSLRGDGSFTLLGARTPFRISSGQSGDGKGTRVRFVAEPGERPLLAEARQAGKRVVKPKFGVDEDVCTGDHACMRLSGCPSLSLKKLDDPLREDPVAYIDPSCVGCGNCGEVAAVRRAFNVSRIAVGHTPGDSVRVECGGEFLALDSALGRHFRASGNNYCESELVSATAGYACPRVSDACEGQIVRFRRNGDEWSVDVVDSDDAAQDRVEL